MKKITILFVLALAFAGCSTDDTSDVPEGMLRKVRVIPFVADEEYTARYYYDGHKLERTETSNNTRQIYVYDGDLIVNIKSYEDTDLVEEKQFQYDGSGRLVQQYRIDNEIDWHNKSIYVYNLDGTVTESRYNYHTGDPETLAYTRQFFFADGEVAQEILTAGDVIQTTTYTYDDKLVPEHGITGFDKIRTFNPEGYRGINHNIVHVEQTYSNSPDIGTYSYIWTYNEQGAPTAFSNDDEGTIIIDGGLAQYFYK